MVAPCAACSATYADCIHQPEKPPPEDALQRDDPELHSKFLQTTVTAMQRIQRQQHADVLSSVNKNTMAPIFLDDTTDGDIRKATVGTGADLPIQYMHANIDCNINMQNQGADVLPCL